MADAPGLLNLHGSTPCASQNERGQRRSLALHGCLGTLEADSETVRQLCDLLREGVAMFLSMSSSFAGICLAVR